MVRAWTLEAYAHGAEVVSYFRWRQAPFAQEQMHAGLNLPDGREDVASDEVRAVMRDLAQLPDSTREQAPVALVFDYEADWLLRVQPQGASFRYMPLVLEFYSALRRLGLDVDIVPVGAALDAYRLVVVPTLPVLAEEFVAQLGRLAIPVLFGPRTGSKNGDFQIPARLPPGPLQRLLPIVVPRVESLRPGLLEHAHVAGESIEVGHWLEHVESAIEPALASARGRGLWYRNGRFNYLACWPPAALLRHALRALCAEAQIHTIELPPGLRIARRGNLHFAFNYDKLPLAVPADAEAEFVIGDRNVPPAGVAVWRNRPVS